MKQYSLDSAFGCGFFGTVTNTVMTPIVKSPDLISDSGDSDTPPPPNSKSTVYQKIKQSKAIK